MKQKEAVVKITKQVMGGKYSSDVPVKDTLTKLEMEEIRTLLFNEFKAGNIDLNKEFSDKELKKYIRGLVFNHFKKAKELNGGVRYRPNKSSNTTTRKKKIKDAKLDILNKMAKLYHVDSDEYANVMLEIKNREEELQNKKTVSERIDNLGDITVDASNADIMSNILKVI